MALDNIPYANAIALCTPSLCGRIRAELTYRNNENFKLPIAELRKEIRGK